MYILVSAFKFEQKLNYVRACMSHCQCIILLDSYTVYIYIYKLYLFIVCDKFIVMHQHRFGIEVKEYIMEGNVNANAIVYCQMSEFCEFHQPTRVVFHCSSDHSVILYLNINDNSCTRVAQLN